MFLILHFTLALFADHYDNREAGYISVGCKGVLELATFEGALWFAASITLSTCDP